MLEDRCVVPKFYGHYQNGSSDFLVLEYCGVPPSRDMWISETFQSKVRHVLNALHEFGVHHHDVRQENVLVKGDGTVRLVDLHLAVDLCDLGNVCPDDSPFY
jgi:serine/threonine protein kinase